jgi:hypothetical protein
VIVGDDQAVGRHDEARAGRGHAELVRACFAAAARRTGLAAGRRTLRTARARPSSWSCVDLMFTTAEHFVREVGERAGRPRRRRARLGPERPRDLARGPGSDGAAANATAPARCPGTTVTDAFDSLLPDRSPEPEHDAADSTAALNYDHGAPSAENLRNRLPQRCPSSTRSCPI